MFFVSLVNVVKYVPFASANVSIMVRRLIAIRKQFYSKSKNCSQHVGYFSNIESNHNTLGGNSWTINEYECAGKRNLSSLNFATNQLNFLRHRQYFVFSPRSASHNAFRRWGCRVVSGMVLESAGESKSHADRCGRGMSAKIKIGERTVARGFGHRSTTETMFATSRRATRRNPLGWLNRARRERVAFSLKEMTMNMCRADAGPVMKHVRRSGCDITPHQALCFGQHTPLIKFC